MINLNNLTPKEQKELKRLTKKAGKMTPEEEEKIIQFFMGLIPILQEAALDLEQKGLLNRKDFETSKEDKTN